MGDISAEPSMEDILSSIKRIIAEEGDAASAARGVRRGPRAVPPPTPLADDFGHDEILELSEPADASDEEAPVAAVPAATRVETAPPETKAVSEPILSPQTTLASRSPLEALSRMVVKPEVAGTDTLEAMVREMLRPMLREWLDANLPGMVEDMVAREIARITGAR